MKRILLFSLVLGGLLAACNDSGSDTGSSDTLNTEQNNPANATGDTSAAGNNNTTGNTGTSFKAVMDKMMQDMHSMTMTEDPDHDFAMMMKSHHQGAIDMANIELAQGSDAELKQVAQKMITDAQKDMADLNSFLSSNQPSKKSDFHKKMMDKMMASSSGTMDHGGNIDMEFAMMMEMHHQQGVDMSRDYLKTASAAQTKKVANNTIQSNSEDIKKLKAWQSKNKGGTDHSGH